MHGPAGEKSFVSALCPCNFGMSEARERQQRLAISTNRTSFGAAYKPATGVHGWQGRMRRFLARSARSVGEEAGSRKGVSIRQAGSSRCVGMQSKPSETLAEPFREQLPARSGRFSSKPEEPLEETARRRSRQSQRKGSLVSPGIHSIRSSP